MNFEKFSDLEVNTPLNSKWSYRGSKISNKAIVDPISNRAIDDLISNKVIYDSIPNKAIANLIPNKAIDALN